MHGYIIDKLKVVSIGRESSYTKIVKGYSTENNNETGSKESKENNTIKLRNCNQ